MKIAYLHGLDSNTQNPKNDWLRTLATVYDPEIDYRATGIYQRIFNELKAFQPDVILGSSMGGFFAYHMARSLNLPMLLFNPALSYRSFTPDMQGWTFAVDQPYMQLAFGENDDLLPWKDTLNWLREQPYSNYGFSVGDHGHQTPLGFFQQEVNTIVQQLQLSKSNKQ